MNILIPVNNLLFHNMLIFATSRGQLPTQGISLEYLTDFSSLSLKQKYKKKKKIDKNTLSEFRALLQTSPASFVSPAPFPVAQAAVVPAFCSQLTCQMLFVSSL